MTAADARGRYGGGSGAGGGAWLGRQYRGEARVRGVPEAGYNSCQVQSGARMSVTCASALPTATISRRWAANIE